MAIALKSATNKRCVRIGKVASSFAMLPKVAILLPLLLPLMPDISFFLKYANRTKDSSIKLIYYCADKKLEYYTGECGNTSNWDIDHQVSSNRGTRAKLNRLRAVIEQMEESSKITGKALLEADVRQRLNEAKENKKYPLSALLLDKMTIIVNEMESGERTTPVQKKRYSPGSIKTHRFTIDFLRRFKPNMTVEGVTMGTYNEFIKWCHDLDYSTNYIGSQIKNWMALGNYVGGNSIYQTKAFRKLTEDTTDIALSEEELGIIYKQDLPFHLDTYRDWVIIDCYTGLRISDVRLLGGRNIGNDFITIANEKTDTQVVIPLHPYVREILKKYGGLPPSVTEQDMNKNIKEIGKKCGINKTVLYSITKGGKRKDEYLEKWQMLSNHTCRRSLITNLRKTGIPDSIIMKLTGIKSILTLMKYDKLEAGEAAEIAAKHRFFKPKGKALKNTVQAPDYLARLIVGFFRGSLSHKDMHELNQWAASSEQNAALFEQMVEGDARK